MKWLVLVGFIMSLNVAHASGVSGGDPNLSNTHKKANCSHQVTTSRAAQTTPATSTQRPAAKRNGQHRRVQ